jgi:hypothetical protein
MPLCKQCLFCDVSVLSSYVMMFMNVARKQFGVVCSGVRQVLGKVILYICVRPDAIVYE